MTTTGDIEIAILAILRRLDAIEAQLRAPEPQPKAAARAHFPVEDFIAPPLHCLLYQALSVAFRTGCLLPTDHGRSDLARKTAARYPSVGLSSLLVRVSRLL